MNLRPPGPQPGALPDCATPRGSFDSRRNARLAVLRLCEHTFVPSALSDHSQLRKCGRCGQLKPTSDYAWRRKARGQLDNYCRPCRATYKHEHYTKHRALYVVQAQRRKQALALERAVLIVGILRKRPCADCDETDPIVLEFDHLGDKTFDVAKGLRDHSWQAVLDEIAKCDVVCANCHRRRTAKRAGFARAVVAQW